MLAEGDTAPRFELPGVEPGAADADIAQFRLADALESGPAVVNFYPFDFHPSCTEHMCTLRDLSWFDVADAVTVYGISTDGSFSHRAFAAAESLDFPLLSDNDGSVAEDYGVLYDEIEGHKRVSKRAVFVVDADREIRYAWRTDDPEAQPNWTPVRDAVAALTGSETAEN